MSRQICGRQQPGNNRGPPNVSLSAAEQTVEVRGKKSSTDKAAELAANNVDPG